MQCPLLPSPLSCSVRRESCSQTDEALRSSSCYKYSVVSLELVSLREKKKKKDKASVKVHCSFPSKFTSLPSCSALTGTELFPGTRDVQKTWDHLSHPSSALGQWDTALRSPKFCSKKQSWPYALFQHWPPLAVAP